MPPLKGVIPIPLRTVSDPDKVTPVGLKQDMAKLGLICSDTEEKKLDERIKRVRSQMTKTSLKSFMIGQPLESLATAAENAGSSMEEHLATELNDGARNLVEPVAAADPAMQNLYRILGSNDPGTRRYVEHTILGDPVAVDVYETINDPSRSARSFVEQLAAADGGKYLTGRLMEYESAGLTYFATLAQAGVTPVALGSWTVGTETIINDVSSMLKVIQQSSNYAKLKSHYDQRSKYWPGRTADRKYPEQYMKTGDAIETFYSGMLTAVAKLAFKDINSDDAEAMITKVIAKSDELVKEDYHKKDSLLLFLAENYKPDTGSADGVGVITLDWEMTIKDYKRKTKHGGDTHKVTLNIDARSISYSGAPGFSDMCEDNKFLTGSCESSCATLKKWYQDNPGHGTWPNTNTTCPPA